MKIGTRIIMLCFLVTALCAVSAALLLQPNSTRSANASALLDVTPSSTPSTDPNDFTTQGSYQFAPVTIADFGPVTTNADIPGDLAVNGDWAIYTSSNIVCGHCGNIANIIYGQNLITGRIVKIKGATANSPYPASDGRVGVTEVKLQGTTITWVQPAAPVTPPTPSSGGGYQAGDYDCARCYYDLETGQHGEVVGERLPPITPPAWSVETSPYDPNDTGLSTITVTQQPTGTLAFRTTFKDYWFAGQFAFDNNKMIYVQSQGGYGVPQLVRVAWLLPTNPEFTNVWKQADAAVAAGKAARSWLWGPTPRITRYEQYAQGNGQQREVQYYDKSRMEVNNPQANPKAPGFITNGLLTVELISGEIQTGDTERVKATLPSDIPVAGDTRKFNPLTPGYSTLLSVATIHGENQAENRSGQHVDDAIDVHGVVSKDNVHSSLATYTAYSDETKHNIPDIFNKYLTGMNATYGFDWTFVLGYPITEAYWTQMRVGGKDMPVLIQAYQRRVLTYVPDFEPTWQVQQGNVGQHYLEWITLNNENVLDRPDGNP